MGLITILLVICYPVLPSLGFSTFNVFLHFCIDFLFFVFGCAGSSLLCGLSSSCSKRGCSLVVVHGLLTAVDSLLEHGLQAQGLQQLQSIGSIVVETAQMLRDMWDLPGSGIEPTSPALAGGLFTMSHQGSLLY